MKKITINGKEITTNYSTTSDYPLDNGNGKTTMVMETKEWTLHDGETYCRPESDKEMIERLVELGYSRITFYRTTTNIRGYYKTIAYCK